MSKATRSVKHGLDRAASKMKDSVDRGDAASRKVARRAGDAVKDAGRAIKDAGKRTKRAGRDIKSRA
jgi:hypothetical protein